MSFVYLVRSRYCFDLIVAVSRRSSRFRKAGFSYAGTTERPEALEAGTVKLVGTDYDKIVNEVSGLLDSREYYEKMSKAVNPYGDGKACCKIIEALLCKS